MTAGDKVLDLYGEGIADEGLALLLCSPNLHQLERLRLQLNGLTPGCAASMLAHGEPLALRSLDLSGNHIGDEGFLAIVLGARFPHLVSLDIAGNGVSDEALAKYLRHTPPGSLTRLFMGAAPIDMRVWWSLAARLGDGLFASAEFKEPYEPPFAADKLICFSYVFRSLTEPQLSFGFETDTLHPWSRIQSRLFFLLADYTRELWLRNTQLHQPGRGPRQLTSNVESVRRVEALGHQPHPVVMLEEGSTGFELLSRGLTPDSFNCGRCNQMRSGESLRVEVRPDDLFLGKRFMCPEEHLLFQEEFGSNRI